MRRFFKQGVICGAIVYLVQEGRAHGTKEKRVTELAEALGISRNTVEKHCRILEESQIAEVSRQEVGNNFAWQISLLVDEFYFRSDTGMMYSAKEMYEHHNRYINKKTKIRTRDMFR